MKFRKISILALAFGAIISFAGCGKDDGAIPNRVTIDEVPTITTLIDPTGSQSINLLNLAAFSGKFKVDLYFPGAKPPTKVDIVVRKFNGSVSNNNNVRVFKTDVSTLPATYTVTAAELAALFGAPIALGDNYDFGPDIYVGNQKYEAFPAGLIGTGAGVIGQPLYSEFARFAAICAYDPAIYQGNFVVVSDAWADFSPGEIVVLTRLSNSSFSFIDPYATPFPAGPTPIVVNVNTANNSVSIARTVIGTKWVWSAVYTGPAVATSGTTSAVAPCSQTVTLNMQYSVDQGTFSGTYPLVLRKQ